VTGFSVFSQGSCRLGKEYPRPEFSEATRKNHEVKLAEAENNYRQDSSGADNIIWLGRRKAYLGLYDEAIDVFSRGIWLHPADARIYRHRGHRYLTLRCFDKAIADFKKAAQLTKGKVDVTEPDGLPNAKNIPTSTLQSNIWYHLGLVYFIKGDYKKALKAYTSCLEVSNNPDMYVATANWLYLTYRKLKNEKKAEKLLSTVQEDMELIENKDYHAILMLYKQKPGDEQIKAYFSAKKELSQSSFGFGAAMFLLNNGKPEEAKTILNQIIQGNQWSSFGYIAAAEELRRIP
jgi:tetratricopeptide (TPR) repeat protein